MIMPFIIRYWDAENATVKVHTRRAGGGVSGLYHGANLPNCGYIAPVVSGQQPVQNGPDMDPVGYIQCCWPFQHQH